MTPPPKLPAAVVGNVGMYYACYKLSLLGWNVMPTARNAKGIDIVAYNQTGKKMIGIQVKTLSKKSAVPLGTSLDKIMGNFWIIVNNVADAGNANTFIMKPEEVKKLATRSGGESNPSFWLEPRDYDTAKFKEQWKRIGPGIVVEKP